MPSDAVEVRNASRPGAGNRPGWVVQDCGNGDPVDEPGGGFGELILIGDGEKIAVVGEKKIITK